MNKQIVEGDHAYEVLIYQRELDKIEKIIKTNNMLLNSTRITSDGNADSSQQPLLLNTSSFNSENLQNCLSISRDIERQERLRQINRRLSHPTPLEATLTYEEIYECSLEDDHYYTAQDYQHSTGPRQVTDLDVSLSINDCMGYFDEDVNVDSGPSRCDTPNKLPSYGTVAAAVANFQTQMSKSMGSPPPPYKEHASPRICKQPAEPTPQTSSSIQQLRKKYEQNIVNEPNPKIQEKPPKVKELRRSMPTVPSPTLRPKSPKPTRKSKVKQMAHMFNNKIHQLMRRDTNEKKGYNQMDVTQTQNLNPPKKQGILKSTNKVRRWPSFRTGLPSPVPSPRFKRKPGQNTTDKPLSDSESACLVAEDVFRKLSVKDKALLYNKFIEDMAKQHPQFSVHARLVEATVQQELERSEREQKPPKVKELARELETKFNLSKPKISTWALKRLAELQKTPEYEAVNRRISISPPPPAIAAALQSLQEQDEEPNDAKQTECEVDDEEVETEELHVSTLTVVLKPSPDKLAPKREVPRILPRKTRELQFIHDMRKIERSSKRSNESMRASVSFEAYGPPKKIRRTRAERLQPKAIFQNAHMERLFYNWIMEKNGVTFDITTVENSEDSLCANGEEVNTSKSSTKSKSKVHVLLEKAKAKLESVEARVMRRDSYLSKKTEKALKIIKETREQQVIDKSIIEVELSHINSKTGTSSDEVHAETANRKTQRKVKRQAPQPPKAESSTKNPNSEQRNEQDFSSLTSSDKQSEAESESGLSSLPKITSDESQPEQTAPPAYANKTTDFEFAKPIKPARKKKLRRTLTWKKENCIIESRPIPSSTDSESDHTKAPEKIEEEEEEVVYVNVMQPPKQTDDKPTKNQINEMAVAAQEALNKEQQENKTINDETIMNNLNTPQKIRSAYTLTAMSTPSAHTESDPSPLTESDPEIGRKHSIRQLNLSSPSLKTQQEKQQPELPEKSVETKSGVNNKSTLDITQPEDTLQKLIDSFVDLGFETGSNGMESPVRRPAPVPKPRRSKGSGPLFIKLTPELEKTLQQNRSSFSSTPVRGMTTNQSYQAFNNNAARQLQQQSLSPIGTLTAARRRSLNPVEDPRRNSIAMQVICEDRPLEHVDRSQTQTPQSATSMETSFFGNSFNLNVSHNNEQQEKTSKFWIRAEDFTINMDVFYNPPDRLRLLYDIFSQKSSETSDLHFGIDDYKFSTQKSGDKADISNRLPAINGCSHYWFSTGDLAVPFNGKCLAPEKIERMFTFIKETINEKTQLRFGVDDYEFSRVPDNMDSCAKFSMESSYSMLVGLQGTNNGLDGRGRTAWPSSVYNSANSNASSIKTSDLDCSVVGSDFDDSELRYLTESPTGTNYYDVASVDSADLILPRKSNETKCEHVFDMKFDFDTLDKLFEEDQKKALNKSLDSNHKQSIPEMLQKLQNQRLKLTALEKRMKTYSNHSGIAGAVIPHSKESPLYMHKLRTMIHAIDNIGRETDFKACSMKQLENFMFFLTRYADMCLASCDKHMNKVLDALLDQQQKQQEELIKSNNELGVA
ncbi:uncharacterized protein LOC115066576 [Bactrocera dorsalis]|uniref:Uncharacterized protein LOC115066576 n=2 Tax=Bactrocera dorsalis TaxID=27457 RepID=A0A8N4L932_BACDO|nr:uncharacterized protein LOC115066576 [Bactrocera dorsalis]